MNRVAEKHIVRPQKVSELNVGGRQAVATMVLRHGSMSSVDRPMMPCHSAIQALPESFSGSKTIQT